MVSCLYTHVYIRELLYLCSAIAQEVRGPHKGSSLLIKRGNAPSNKLYIVHRQIVIKQMISKSAVEQAVNEWLEGKDYFLVEVTVSADDRVVVVIDHAEGVWIEDCADLSRYIESRIDREEEDYELEVGSAGLGYPFKVLRQYQIHVGKSVETQQKDGRKYRGELTAVDETTFSVTTEEKVRKEGEKRAHKEMVTRTFSYEDTVYTKYYFK